MVKAEVKKTVKEWFEATEEKVVDIDMWSLAGREHVNVVTVSKNHVVCKHYYTIEDGQLRHISTGCLV